MKVVMIRHGKTAGNLLRQYIGRTDQPLCDTGIEELEKVFESEEFQKKADPLNVKTIIVSPMTRCKETAKILFPNAVLIVKEDLREMDFGIFEEKSAFEMENFDEYRKWLSTHCEAKIPEGEDKARFSQRCCNAFSEVITKSEDEVVYFLVHGGTIMSVFEKYADEKKEYYKWYAENGHGYMADWIDGILTNIETI